MYSAGRKWKLFLCAEKSHQVPLCILQPTHWGHQAWDRASSQSKQAELQKSLQWHCPRRQPGLGLRTIDFPFLWGQLKSQREWFSLCCLYLTNLRVTHKTQNTYANLSHRNGHTQDRPRKTERTGASGSLGRFPEEDGLPSISLNHPVFVLPKT